MSQDKDEIVKMAREAGLWVTGFPTEHIEHFAALCRAPLVAENAVLKQAHEINADTLNAMQVEIDDWKARALKAEQAGEQEIAGYFVPEGWDALGRVTDWAQVVKNQGTPLYATPPRPAAQEPDCATTGVCVRSGLYASPPSAVPVVEQLVEALSRNRIMAADSDGNYTREVTPRVITAAIAAGQQYLKENGK